MGQRTPLTRRLLRRGMNVKEDLMHISTIKKIEGLEAEGAALKEKLANFPSKVLSAGY